VIRARVSVVLLAVLSSTVSLAAEGAAPALLYCNQLGREIALQAAEQLSVTLDVDSRTQLASIAEQACLDYARTAQPAATENDPAAAVAPEKKNEFFDLELIDPADRVRRPGLKRR
jgi:hypothetical protein